MSRLLACLALMVSMGCGTPASPDAGLDAGTDAGVYVPTERRLLGLNDVTWLLPLEALDAA